MPGRQTTAGRLAALATVIIGQRLLVSAIDFDGSSYARNVSLDADIDIFWTIDEEAATVRVAVHATAATGWMGLGVSEMGGMEGADIVFYEAAVRPILVHRCIAPILLLLPYVDALPELPHDCAPTVVAKSMRTFDLSALNTA